MKKIFTLLVSALAITQAMAQCANCPIPFINSSQATGTQVSVTVNKPNGVNAGDVMIAAIHIGWCNSGPNVTPPNGWTLINYTSNTGPGCGSGNTTKQLATFYKVAGAVEPANYTFTGNAANQEYVGGIVAYSGVNTSMPINASSTFGMQDLCTSIVASSVTTTVSCTRLVAVFFCSVNSSATNIVPQNSLTERVDVNTTGNHPWGNENLEMSDELFTAMGATGNKTAFLTGCSGNSWVTGGQLIALACNSSTGMNENALAGLVSISPNPTNGKFTLRISNAAELRIKNAEIYNALGEKIYHSELLASNSELDLSSQPKGIYFLKLFSEHGTIVKKIVVD